MRKDTFFRDERLGFCEARCTETSEASYRPHLHSTFSIGAVKAGQVAYTVETTTATLRPGALALINPETVHSCNAINHQPRSYFMLYLEVDWCLEVQQALWGTTTFCPVTTSHLQSMRCFTNYCAAMTLLFDNSCERQAKEEMLLLLVADIFAQACPPLPAAPIVNQPVARLKDLLRRDLSHDLSLIDLARALSTNPYTLLRRFKAETGITPHAYRQSIRIEAAKSMLRQGVDIGEAALCCGFYDQSHLHRHFKAITTLTPRQYQVNFVQ